MPIAAVNPGTQQTLATHNLHISAQVEQTLAQAVAAQSAWGQRPIGGVRQLKVGNPEALGTQVGPLARAILRVGIHWQVTRSLAEGARLVVGGAPVEGSGNFYAPTVLDHLTPHMAVAGEETFGPAAAVIGSMAQTRRSRPPTQPNSGQERPCGAGM